MVAEDHDVYGCGFYVHNNFAYCSLHGKEKGITGYSGLTKDEIARLIKRTDISKLSLQKTNNAKKESNKTNNGNKKNANEERPSFLICLNVTRTNRITKTKDKIPYSKKECPK